MDTSRYSRQVLFSPIGEAGQRSICAARVTLVGCGALGSVLASILARAGVGHLRIVDRDFVELSNLQRQTLFDEDDVRDNLPKAEAAARRLRRINGDVTVEPVVADFNPTNAEKLCANATLLLDGTDNLETRFLLNDVAVKYATPWVYGACVGAEGRVLSILPGETPCLRCLWDEPPPPGSLPTCETAGVIGPIVHIVAGFQGAEALKVLAGKREEVARNMLVIEAWTGRVHSTSISGARDAECPCCGRRDFEFLRGERAASTTALCGRNAVQVLPPKAGRIDLDALARRLPAELQPQVNAFLLRLSAEGCEITVFPDGRAIVRGTNDVTAAKAIYARYVSI